MFDWIQSCYIRVHRLPDCTLQTKPGIRNIIVHCAHIYQAHSQLAHKNIPPAIQ